MHAIHMEIPSGRVYLRGHEIYNLDGRAYIWEDGVQVYLTDDEKSLGQEMREVFADVIDTEVEA